MRAAQLLRTVASKVPSASMARSARTALCSAAAISSTSAFSAAVPRNQVPVHSFKTSTQLSAASATKCENYNDPKFKKFAKVPQGKKLVVLGFGAIGTGVLPILFRHLEMTPDQLIVVSDQFNAEQLAHAKSYGVQTHVAKLTVNDWEGKISPFLNSGDFLINLSVDVSSCALIELCQKKDVLYMDTCNEPWAGGYSDPNIPLADRTNYAFREEALEFRKRFKKDGPTALITHGANPGLVSHFVKESLLHIARDTGVALKSNPRTREEWTNLAEQLGIKSIHIAERDTQASGSVIKHDQEFVNTWSIEGYVEEGKQPAELGWGTHEKEFPANGVKHENGCKAAIFLNRPGALTNVRTWTPFSGSFHGMLITHTEAISIADYFTKTTNGKITYRPTVHFAYHACDNAWMSLHQVAGREWVKHPTERLMRDEISTGRDELGVLLMGHKKGAYWYGSDLTIEKTRELVPHNNATSLQVCTGVLTGVIYAYENPRKGIVEPEEIEHERIIEIGANYLGNLHGKYTDWTPLHRRNLLFKEDIDESDPWQFKNFIVQ